VLSGLFFRVTNFFEFAPSDVCAAKPEAFEVKYQADSSVDMSKRSLHAHHPPTKAVGTHRGLINLATWALDGTMAKAASLLPTSTSHPDEVREVI